MIGIAIGNYIKVNADIYWPRYWIRQPECYELWKITGAGNLVGLKRGDILIVGGTVGNYTFKVPNTAPYQTYDTDYIWFKTDLTWRTATEAEMVGYDFAKTIVKYGNASPYFIDYIMILSLSVTGAKLNKLHTNFQLPLFWSGVENINGVIKGNRGFIQSTWTPEVTAPDAPSDMILTLISGGVRISFTDNSGGTAKHEIYGKIDSGSYALITTLDEEDVSYDDIRTPEDLMTYKIRAKIGTSYSGYCTEDDIAMLGANLIPSASSDFTTDGTAWWEVWKFTPQWNAVTHDFTCNGTGVMELYKTICPVTGTKYLIRFDAKSSNATVKFMVHNASGLIYTDLTNFTTSTSYQTFKYIGTQATNRLIDFQSIGSVDGKEVTFDNIKIQEVL